MAQAEAQTASEAADQAVADLQIQVDLLNAELELSSAALTQLDNEDKFQSAVGALEDAVQSPADSLAKVIEKISKERKPNEK